MNKEQIIKEQGTLLRIKHRANELSEFECREFIEGVADALQPLYSKSDQKQFLITSFDKMDKTHITMLELAQFDDLADNLLEKEDSNIDKSSTICKHYNNGECTECDLNEHHECNY